MVYAQTLSHDAVLSEIRAGRSWIAESAAVRVALTAESDGRTAGVGDDLELPADQPVEIRAEIAGVPDGLARLITDEGQVHQQPLTAEGAGSIRLRTTASGSAYVRLEVRHPRRDGTLGSGTEDNLDPALGPIAALTNPIFLKRTDRPHQRS